MLEMEIHGVVKSSTRISEVEQKDVVHTRRDQ